MTRTTYAGPYRTAERAEESLIDSLSEGDLSHSEKEIDMKYEFAETLAELGDDQYLIAIEEKPALAKEIEDEAEDNYMALVDPDENIEMVKDKDGNFVEYRKRIPDDVDPNAWTYNYASHARDLRD